MSSSTLPTLGRYEIIRVLGRGAMGLVYEARDPNLDRRVAIKTIRVDGLSPDAADEYAARFRTEARSAARLQHPNIVSVYDSDRDGEVAYLVMEFVQGEDLKHHLDAGTRFTLEQTLRIAADLLAALDYAHRQAIVHRDIKPANLLLEASGRVKLADFGVARIQDTGEATRTRGSMVGTLKYMSPEQVQGQPVDARSDLFAAGVVLYQLLTGRRPFEGDTDFAIIHQIVAQPLVPASSLNPQLPAALDAVLDRAMAKAREDRYATARDFVQALQDACGSLVDRTILAPPFQGSPVGNGSAVGLRGSRSGSTTVPFGARTAEDTGATVTQELELVYWKDVRDSPDAVDLEGFLERFPEGIYADLARRRLRKLTGQETGTRGTAYDATRMDAPTTLGDGFAGLAPPGGTVAPDPVAPLPASLGEAALPSGMVAAPDAPGMPASAPPAGLHAASGRPQDTPAASTAPPSLPTRATPAVQGHPAEPPPARRGPRGLVWAAVGAVVVVAVLAYQGLRSGDTPAIGSEATATEAELPASAASAPASVAEAPLPEAAASAASAAAAPVLAASAAVPAASAASAARNNPARAQARQGAASGPVSAQAPHPAASSSLPVVSSALADPGRAGAAAATPSSAPVRPVARPAVATPADPTQACQGRVLLGYQICLNDQCALPAFAQHPVCVERREAEKMRRERFGNERN